MDVRLTPELERLVQEKVAAGLYNTESEVVQEALRLLAEQDELRARHHHRLQRALKEGLEQADRGELLDADTVIAGIRESLRSRLPSTKSA